LYYTLKTNIVKAMLFSLINCDGDKTKMRRCFWLKREKTES